MIPYYTDPWLTVYHGDARAVMAEMEPESVHCVVTSPPYWGLRDYGAPGQLGLEPTPEEYVDNIVAVFREVRRVLRSDGTVWLNLGDSYNNAGSARNGEGLDGRRRGGQTDTVGYKQRDTRRSLGVIKHKDLVGIPWRVAFALQADGWYLRSDIIWSKPNPMPESVTDRPTKAHEYLFLLSKSPRYYYDADAVRESSHTPQQYGAAAVVASGVRRGMEDPRLHHHGKETDWSAGRNLRSVWTIATAPYPGAHFATFPPKLVEPCIKAGTSEKGVCPACGAPWVREVEREGRSYRDIAKERGGQNGYAEAYRSRGKDPQGLHHPGHRGPNERVVSTTGWRLSCSHWPDYTPVPAVILDPFAGSGTTGMVAQSLSRRAVLIDLSMDYLGQLMERNRDMPLGLTS